MPSPLSADYGGASTSQYFYLPNGWDAAWKAAKANAASQRVNVVGIGDSVLSGYEATDFMVTSFWAKLRAAILAANGNLLGGDHYGMLYSSALGQGATATFPIVINVGGNYIQYYGGYTQCLANGTVAYTPFMSCTPPYAVTGFDIVYIDYGGGGTWAYNVDGGTNTNVTTTGPASFAGSIVKKVSVTGLTSASHTLNINCTATSANCIISGVTGYSGTTGLCFANMGQNSMGLVTGLTAHDALSDTTIFPPDKLALYQGYQGTTAAPTALLGYGFPAQPDLALIEFGINDASQSVTRANFRDALDRLVWSLRYGKGGACSIIIMAAYCPDGTITSASTVANTDYTGGPSTFYRDIKAAMIEVAQANTCAFVDVHGAFGRTPVTNGWIQSGTDVHPTTLGHAKIANLLSAIV